MSESYFPLRSGASCVYAVIEPAAQVFVESQDTDDTCRYHPGRLRDYDSLGALAIGNAGDFWDCCEKQISGVTPLAAMAGPGHPGVRAGTARRSGYPPLGSDFLGP